MIEGLAWLDFVLLLHANLALPCHAHACHWHQWRLYILFKENVTILSFTIVSLFRSVATALQCFQSWVGITVQSFIIASLACKSFDRTMDGLHDDWGTIQSVLNMMKAPSCNHTSSIHCWSFKGLMWMLTMVRPRTVATHVKRQDRLKDKHRHDMTAKICMQP